MGDLKISKKRFCQDIIEEYSRIKRFLEYSTLENYDEDYIKQFFSSTLLNRFLIPYRNIELTTLRFGGVYSRIMVIYNTTTIELSTNDFIFCVEDTKETNIKVDISLNRYNQFLNTTVTSNFEEIYSHSDSEFDESIEILSGEFFREEELEILGPCKSTFSRIFDSIEKYFGM